MKCKFCKAGFIDWVGHVYDCPGVRRAERLGQLTVEDLVVDAESSERRSYNFG